MTDHNDPWWLPAHDDAGDHAGQADTAAPPTAAASTRPMYADAPPDGTPPGDGSGAPDRRRSRWVSIGLATLLVAIGGAVGAGATTVLWKRLSNAGSNGASGLPGAGPFRGFGNGAPFDGDGTPSGGSGGSGSSSGPADAASIARHVNAGIVDITVSSSYLGFQGAGTGMVLTSSGEVLTNNHVISGATRITATDVGNGKTYTARVVGYDVSHDVAVLQLSDAAGLTTVPLGNSSKLRVGASVVAVGNAGGRGGTPSYAGGTVTALDQSITASDPAAGTSEPLSGLVETNAAVVSGDSGGPLVNTAGQVVAMDTAASAGFRFDSTGNRAYAVPINTALTIARQIESGIRSGTAHVGPTAFLGVNVQSSDRVGAGGSGETPSGSGAQIADVLDGGPAASAGLVAGDVITSVDGRTVTSADSLTAVMLDERPGGAVTVTYLDPSGQQRSATVTLSSGPPR